MQIKEKKKKKAEAVRKGAGKSRGLQKVSCVPTGLVLWSRSDTRV